MGWSQDLIARLDTPIKGVINTDKLESPLNHVIRRQYTTLVVGLRMCELYSIQADTGHVQDPTTNKPKQYVSSVDVGICANLLPVPRSEQVSR